MILTDRWDGSDAPFQGDRTLRLLLLPAGARVARARVRVEPVSGDGADPFVELLSFEPGAAPGAAAAQVRRDGGGATGPSWTEVDLRGRRTLHSLEGELAGARLYVDLGGGVFTPVSAAGGIAPAEDEAFQLGASPAPVPGVAATRLRLLAAAAAAPVPTAVRVRSVPSGVTLRLGDDAPFWVHPGELSAPTRTADFAPLLAAWLQAHGRAEHGCTAVPLTLHTETLGRFRVEVEVEAWMEAGLLPPAVREATFPFDFATHSLRAPGTATWAGDLSARLPAGARAVAGETRIRLIGAFGETRVVPGRGPTGVVDPAQAKGRALVTADYAQAQEIPPGAEARVVGVDVLVHPLTRSADLQLDLRGDEDGKPGSPLLPAPVRVRVAQGEAADRPVWVGAALAEPFHVDADRRYWIVLQALGGEAEWIAYPHDAPAARRLDLTGLPNAAPPPRPALLNTADGGLSWRSGGPLVALFRLRAAPPRFTVPVQVEAGSGPDALRVPLSRFDALGRVDFTVDGADLAGAVTAAAHVPAGPCPPGEALADGGFAEWVAEGDGVGEPVAVDLHGAMGRALAMAPDGRWLYVLALRGVAPVLLRIDVPSERVVDEVALAGSATSSSNAVGLVVHPDGSRAWALLQRSPPGDALFVQGVDLDTGTLMGPPGDLWERALPHPSSVPVPVSALSPDGETLFVAAEKHLVAIDLPALERGGPSPGADVLRFHKRIERSAVSMAVSPAGDRLVVGFENDEAWGLHVLDLGTFDPRVPGSPSLSTISLPAMPLDVAITPDGSLAVVGMPRRAGPESGGVRLVDLDRGTVLTVQTVQTKEEVPAGFVVALSPDGTRAYVAGRGPLVEVDVVRRSARVAAPATEFSGTFWRLSLTPQGDRLFALYTTGARVDMRAVPVGTRRLARWTAEGVAAIGAARGEKGRGVVLGRPYEKKPDPAALSQVARVGEGCRYVFSFEALAEPESGAVAELVWTGSRDELLEIDPVPLAASDAFGAAFGEEGRPLRPHRRTRVAPPGATRVEVRFRAPAGQAEVAAASLACTAERVDNGDFRLPLRDGDGGWDTFPDPRRAVVHAEPGGGTVVRATGPGAAELVQEVDAAEGTPLALRFEGRARAGPEGEAPALRVRWMDGAGRETGAAAVHPLLPDDFPVHALRLEPPPGTTRAGVALVVPARAALFARSLSLLAAPEVEVPLRFIAQAPGELTVTEARVVYDLGGGFVPAPGAEPSPPSPTSGSGANAGPDFGGAGGEGGEGADGGCHPCEPQPGAAGATASPRTGSTGEAPPRSVSLSTARPPAGARWQPPGTMRLRDVEPGESMPMSARAAPSPSQPAQPGLAQPHASEPEPLAVGPVSPGVEAESVAVTPVRQVAGVGEARERRLAEAGIRSAEELAATRPEELVRADPTFAPIATSLVKAAARLVSQRADMTAAED
jgi:predicted flap endonuclease-1-like 5' DNA nuclease